MPTSFDYYEPFVLQTIMEADWRKQMTALVAAGPCRNQRDELEVTADSSGMHVLVDDGHAVLRGAFGKSTSTKTLTIAPNVSGSARTDRIVVRADFANNVVGVDVLQGTPGAPALTQDATGATVWEESLATVTIVSGAPQIDAGDVTDERLWGVAKNGAGGQVAHLSNTADQRADARTSATTSDFDNWSLSWRARAGRRYRVRFYGTVRPNTGQPAHTGMRLQIREGSTVIAQAKAIDIDASLAWTYGCPQSFYAILDGVSAGLHTYKMSLYVTTGASNAYLDILGPDGGDAYANANCLSIEDCGPVP